MTLPRTFTVALLVALALPRAASGQQVLTLANGDRLTGTLKSVAGGVWTFSFAGGSAKIPAGSVSAFTAPTPIGVRLTDSTIAAVTITTVGDSLELAQANGTVRRIAPADIDATGPANALELLVPVPVGLFTPLDRFWGARGGFGFSNKSGNGPQRGLSLSAQVERKSPRDRESFALGLDRQESAKPGDTLTQTVGKYYGSAHVDVYLGPQTFLFAETRQERDKFQDLKLRSSYQGGVGVQILATKRTDLRFSVSGGTRIERFISTDSVATAPVLGLASGWQQELGPATLVWKVDWTPNVREFADYRLRSDASITTSIIAGLGFRVSAVDEYNSRPQPTFQAHDMLISTALTYSVGG